MEITRLGKIANEFKTFKLKDILQKNDAGDWGDEPFENSIGIVRSTNFNNNGKLDLSDIAFRSLKPQKLKDKKLYAGEILIERSGGSDTQPVGRVGLVTEEMSMQNLAFANFIQRIAIDTTIDSTFLFYCLQQMYEMGLTASMQFQTTGIRNLDWKLYTKSILPKPSLPEQKAIATILTRIDKAIDATEASIRAAERLKRALMQNLLTGKLKPDGTWRTEEEFYSDEKFGKVPVGWDVVKLKRMISDSQYGLNTVSDENGQIPMFRMNNIIDGKMVAHPMVSVNLSPEEANKYRVQKGDILFNRTNSLDLVGKVGIFQLEGFFVYASYLILLRANENNSPDYINYCLNSYKGQTRLRATATPSVSQANINAKSLVNTHLLRPEKEEQEKIAAIIQNSEKTIQSKQAKITKLQRLKNH